MNTWADKDIHQPPPEQIKEESMEAKTWHDTVSEPPCGLCIVFDHINKECTSYHNKCNCPSYFRYIHHSEEAEGRRQVRQEWARWLREQIIPGTVGAIILPEILDAKLQELEAGQLVLDAERTKHQIEIDTLKTGLVELKRGLTNLEVTHNKEVDALKKELADMKADILAFMKNNNIWALTHDDVEAWEIFCQKWRLK